MVGIYRIRNIKNGDCYYGSSKTIEKRLKRHYNTLKNNTHHNIHLQRAWNLYGEIYFAFELFEEIPTNSPTVLLEIEQLYLDEGQKYNIGNAGGGDNISDHPERDIIVEKIRQSVIHRYNTMTDIDRRKLSESKKGDKNPNWRNGGEQLFCKCGVKISKTAKSCIKCRDTKGEKNSFYGKTHTEETIKKFSEDQKGKYLGSKNKPVVIDGIHYRSVGEAATILNLVSMTLRHRIRSKNPKYRNYQYEGETKISYTPEEQKEKFAEKSRGKQLKSKPFYIDDIEYRTLLDASNILYIHQMTIRDRLLNDKFPNYRYK